MKRVVLALSGTLLLIFLVIPALLLLLIGVGFLVESIGALMFAAVPTYFALRLARTLGFIRFDITSYVNKTTLKKAL